MDPTRVDICVYDGIDELDVVGPLEVLRGAVAAGADLDVRLVTRTPSRLVTGTFGLHLVERLVGPDAAAAGARRMEHARTPAHVV
jgi:putative intracellular protease/amidase